MPNFHCITSTGYSPPFQNGILEKTVYGKSAEKWSFND
jgi:hypothetical protein